MLVVGVDDVLVPWFRCTDPECDHRWCHNSTVDDAPDCEECGEPTRIFDPDDDDDVVLERIAPTVTAPAQPRISYARQLARKRVSDAGISEPPVRVQELAAAEGLKIVLRPTLGSLRGRLVGNTIELVKDDPAVVQRFTIAHELGHRALEHEHGSDDLAETEANNYANELLVPGPLLRKAMAATSSAAALRRLFAVSKPVLEIACRHHQCFGSLTD